MIRTSVGYAGGTTENPTYSNIGDHSETIQIDYDPDKISYQELLEVFWKNDSSIFYPNSRQYWSIIFYHDEEQQRLAEDSHRQREESFAGQLFTEVTPFTKFYPAEDYHQKFYLQQEPILLRDLREVYPSFDDFVSSTAVARVNGYVGSFGTAETLMLQLGNLGLSEKGIERLLEIADRGLVPGCSIPE